MSECDCRVIDSQFCFKISKCMNTVVLVVLYGNIQQSNLLRWPTKANRVTGSTMVFLRFSEILLFTYFLNFFSCSKLKLNIEKIKVFSARPFSMVCWRSKLSRIYQVGTGDHRYAKNNKKNGAETSTRCLRPE